MAQVFADPQTHHRQMVVELPHSSDQTVRVVRSPLNFSASPVTHCAPTRLGEHSLQKLREKLNLTDAQVAGLVRRGWFERLMRCAMLSAATDALLT
ncbi:CoA transferase [Limnohabitans sp. T6-5]|uniref:CoA transferase n=1 Tax=Limnohabitans sp. T6-5 TaxID=1100724 RepID=UPI0011B21CAF